MVMRPIIKEITKLKKIKQNKRDLHQESLEMMTSGNYSDNSRAATKRKKKTRLLRETIHIMIQTLRITPTAIIHIMTLMEIIILMGIIILITRLKTRLKILQLAIKKDNQREDIFLLLIHILMMLLTIRIIIFKVNSPRKSKLKI